MSDSSDHELKMRLLNEGNDLPVEELKLPYKEETRSKTMMRGGEMTTLGGRNAGENQKFEMQDLGVRNMSPTTIFKRSSTLRPMTVGTGSSGNNSEPDNIRGVTLNSKNTLVGSGNQPKSRNSGLKFNLNLEYFYFRHQQQSHYERWTYIAYKRACSFRGKSYSYFFQFYIKGSNDSVYIRKQKKKQLCKIVAYNLLETILLILLLLNSVVYPNFGTAIYFIYTLFLTALCLAKDERKIKLKQFISIAIIFVSFAIIITKIVFIVDLHKQDDIQLTEDEVLMYQTSGIYIDYGTSKFKVINVFMSVFFDIMEFILCILYIHVISRDFCYHLLYKFQSRYFMEAIEKILDSTLTDNDGDLGC